MLRRLNEVYAGPVQSPQKPLLKGIKATVRRVVKKRW